MRINGGFFVLRREIFDYMNDGEELVQEPFQRLAAERRLLAYKYDGFWACMDTFKEKQLLEDMYGPRPGALGGLEGTSGDRRTQAEPRRVAV
jgi:glucose-1-phosphate cytidylyltransferase